MIKLETLLDYQFPIRINPFNSLKFLHRYKTATNDYRLVWYFR